MTKNISSTKSHLGKNSQESVLDILPNTTKEKLLDVSQTQLFCGHWEGKDAKQKRMEMDGKKMKRDKGIILWTWVWHMLLFFSSSIAFNDICIAVLGSSKCSYLYFCKKCVFPFSIGCAVRNCWGIFGLHIQLQHKTL